MQKKEENSEIRYIEYPEEITEDGLLLYGQTSMDNCLAVLTHYAHNAEDADEETRRDIVRLAEDWLEAKQSKDKELEYDHEEVVYAVAEPLESDLFADFFKVPFPAPEHPKFTFIDLFAGIGGFRLAMQANGGKCVFSSEWNKFSQKTYMANFGEMPFGDITKEATKSFIPKGFDILCAGFPCQPFSIAGVAKKNSLGRPTGFEDKTQGTLFLMLQKFSSVTDPKLSFLRM